MVISELTTPADLDVPQPICGAAGHLHEDFQICAAQLVLVDVSVATRSRDYDLM